MATLFTSDTHFGHANIIKYCNRPYETVEEMDADLIARWNDTVGPDDIVYHLGDFTLAGTHKAREYFRQLNGFIRVLGTAWHHDRYWMPAWRGSIGGIAHLGDTGLRSAQDMSVVIIPPLHVLEINELGDGTHPLAVTLCHYPLAVWDRKHYGAWHLHGHEHKRCRFIRDGPIYNVGVDENDYAPICLDQIVDVMKKPGWVKPAADGDVLEGTY